MLKKEHIVQLLGRLKKFINENLEKINSLSINIKDEHDSFYYGMITRQLTLIGDLHLLFIKKQNNRLTSEFILFRCIIDDYIHIIWIDNQIDPKTEVTSYNADAYSKNFNKIKELADLNEGQLGGNYPFYPTYSFLEETKEIMKKRPELQVYFLDKENFKFKTFKATGNLIRDLKDVEYSHQLRRAYYMWRELSDFVHYSDFTHKEENSINPSIDTTYAKFAEIIYFSYSLLVACFKYFTNEYNLAITDSDD